MQSIRESKADNKRNHGRVRHEPFTAVGMTCGLMGKEELDPEHRSFASGAASMGFAHRRRRRRRRVDGSALTQRISCAASGYTIHWTGQYTNDALGYLGHSPLNHEMTAIVHRATDTSCPNARVVVPLSTRSG